MAASTQLSAWHARTPGVTSTSGRHAPLPGPVQPAAARCTASASGGGRGGWALPRLARPTEGEAAATPRALGSSPGTMASRTPVTPLQLAQRAAFTPLPAAAAQQAAQQAPSQGIQAAEAGEEPTDVELQRRQKISAANKGRTPWNKGRRHSPETIARIRAGTLKAMQRPEVKQRLAQANEKREPHTDEAKAKIRVKLRRRAEEAREVINAQAEIIVGMMRESGDPVLQRCARYERAVDVVAGLAWQYFKKDWEDVATRGFHEHPLFRDRIVGKITRLANRRRVARSAQRTPAQKRSTLRLAMAHLQKVEEARAKLAQAEGVMAKLQLVKAEFEGTDVERYTQALAAEEKAGAAIAKLRQQLAALEEALQPLQQHLEEAGGPEDEAGSAATGRQRQLELERRLAAVQRQRQERHGEEGQQGDPEQQQHAAALGAKANTNGYADGKAGGALSGPAAVPLRKGLPWHQ